MSEYPIGLAVGRAMSSCNDPDNFSFGTKMFLEYSLLIVGSFLLILLIYYTAKRYIKKGRNEE